MKNSRMLSKYVAVGLALRTNKPPTELGEWEAYGGRSETMKQKKQSEKPIPDVYPVIDHDLAGDTLENDLPEADNEDLWSQHPISMFA